MNIGDLYDPKRLFFGVFIPDWLLKRKEISFGAKAAFAVLVGLSKDGMADLDIPAIAAQIGVSDRQADRYLLELKKKGLILTQRRGLGQTNVYSFPWHPWCDAANLRSHAREVSHPETTHVSYQETTDVSSPSLSLRPCSKTRTRDGARRELLTVMRAHEEPLPGGPEDELDTLYASISQDLFAFLGAETPAQAAEIKRVISLHRDAGRTVTSEVLKAAVADAAEFCKANGRYGTVNALITGLNKALRPEENPANGRSPEGRPRRDSVVGAASRRGEPSINLFYGPINASHERQFQERLAKLAKADRPADGAPDDD